MNKYKDFIPENECGVTVEKGIYYNNPSDLAHEIYFYPMFGAEYRVTYPYQVKRDFMDSFLLMYIKKGELEFRFRNQEFHAKNKIVLLDCKEINSYKAITDSEFYFLHFNSPFMQKIFNKITKYNLPVFNPRQNIENLFIRIFRLISTNTDGQNDPFLSNLTYNLICDLSVTQDNKLKNISSDFHSMPDYIKSTLEFMNRNYNQKIRISDIAHYCSISPSQLSRDFKKYTGMSLHHYLLKVRVKVAKSLLVKDNTIPLDKIASLCGFTDASHLYKKIKEATGLSPGKFRKKYY